MIDLANSPSFEEKAVLEFFETSGRNLLAAEAAAGGVQHHVALSIVGTDRSDNGYFRAKVVQEKLIKGSGIPYTIIRSTQFMEFLRGIADSSTQGNMVRISPGLFQPIAADDVAAKVAEVALAKPRNGIVASDEAGVPLLDEDYLILSTIHSAKGQQWKAVFILSVLDGCIPSDLRTDSTEEIEEERRLLYVAMTRAEDHLHLLLPQGFFAHQQRYNGDRHVHAVRTRFIPASILEHFESVAWPASSVSSGSIRPQAQPIDIGSRMRRMWG